MKIMRVTPESYLKKTEIKQAVFVQLLPQNYAKRKDGKHAELLHFFNHPEMYENAFLPFAKITDIFIFLILF